MNIIKPSQSKLVLIICLALITNEIVPEGWKFTDNFENNSKNYKKK